MASLAEGDVWEEDEKEEGEQGNSGHGCGRRRPLLEGWVEILASFRMRNRFWLRFGAGQWKEKAVGCVDLVNINRRKEESWRDA
ncbi:hypothetical protein HPP92_011063 [Vanilla planifolia]|uniref:Uncharacterized protein n=1 Tax=Vanilla planifolia TaxID=51239 RepID=A0A835V1F4_VANPL|nr:hypothetical protein HPP92_011063 [Vanilla planifolia]